MYLYTTIEELNKAAISIKKPVPGKKSSKVRILICASEYCYNVIRISRVPSYGLCHRCSTVIGAYKTHSKPRITKGHLRPYESSYRSLLRASNQRGMSNNITYEQYYIICQQEFCYYCGKKLNRLMYGSASKRCKYKPSGSRGYSLDRIDNNLGYSVENVVPCCWGCNYIRRDYLTHGEMLIIMQIRVLRANELNLTLEEYTKEILSGG